VTRASFFITYSKSLVENKQALNYDFLDEGSEYDVLLLETRSMTEDQCDFPKSRKIYSGNIKEVQYDRMQNHHDGFEENE
jgi:hypothetical protein